MSADPAVVNIEAEAIKEKGNVAFKAGDLQLAEELYSQAMELDNSNAKYLVNRALCYASLQQWDKSYEDAKRALALDVKSQKAHFRLIKALFELSRFKEARLAILAALKECGETKDNKALEEDLLVRTGIPLRPKSTDFEIVGELGDGNFSKVYKAQHKATDRIFAIKVIISHRNDC
jgi:tetratricopeptide (TPR) repeat protein